LPSVAGFADHLDVALGLQDHPEAGTHELLVVGERRRRPALVIVRERRG
jgi:hypothetical protein